MKITVKELKTLILEAVGGEPVQIGSLSAHIPGDLRYSDTLRVFFVPSDGSVYVTVNETGAAGGMDTFNGATEATESHRKSTGPNARPADVMRLIKSVIANRNFLFAQYGKPTKNFRWTLNDRITGLNTKNAASALAQARGEAVPAGGDGSSEARVLWNGASPDIRAQFLRSEMGFMKEDVPKLAAMHWDHLENEIGLEAIKSVARGVTGSWADIFVNDPDRGRH